MIFSHSYYSGRFSLLRIICHEIKTPKIIHGGRMFRRHNGFLIMKRASELSDMV